jgi:AraC family transcriptional regulator
MEGKIVTFPETKVVAIEHRGLPALEYNAVKKLVAWKLENRLLDQSKYRSYGIHYTNPLITLPAEHRVDFCLSFDQELGPNPFGIRNMVIPELRCALARDIGSRSHNKAAAWLYATWLPQSGESPGDFPIFFHYVNVGPNVREEEMITDVYLPLK